MIMHRLSDFVVDKGTEQTPSRSTETNVLRIIQQTMNPSKSNQRVLRYSFIDEL